MNKTLNRISNTSSYAVSVLMVLVLLLSFVTMNYKSVEDVKFEVEELKLLEGGMHDYYDPTSRRAEFLKVKFNLNVDLEPLFTWNTKQLFVYLVSEYEQSEPKPKQSKVVIWDRIITRKAGSKKKKSSLQKKELNLKKHINKYRFRDLYTSFNGKDVKNGKLSLVIERVPYIGFFTSKTEAAVDLKIPYKEKKVKRRIE